MERLHGAHTRFLQRIAEVQLAGQPFVMKYVVDSSSKGPSMTRRHER
jgi:hypothetical protein